jgi:hypothetical protein
VTSQFTTTDNAAGKTSFSLPSVRSLFISASKYGGNETQKLNFGLNPQGKLELGRSRKIREDNKCISVCAGVDGLVLINSA